MSAGGAGEGAGPPRARPVGGGMAIPDRVAGAMLWVLAGGTGFAVLLAAGGRRSGELPGARPNQHSLFENWKFLPAPRPKDPP